VLRAAIANRERQDLWSGNTGSSSLASQKLLLATHNIFLRDGYFPTCVDWLGGILRRNRDWGWESCASMLTRPSHAARKI
jgi:hypothetical protein